MARARRSISPLIFHAETQPAPFALAERQPKLADLRLLIVDDNATVRRVVWRAGDQMGDGSIQRRKSAAGHRMAQEGRTIRSGRPGLQMSGMDGLALAMRFTNCPGAEMMPLVLLMPLGLHSDAPGSTHIVFSHTVNKPVKPAQLLRSACSRPAQSEGRRAPATDIETRATPHRTIALEHPFVR